MASAPQLFTPEEARRSALRAQCLLESVASVEEALERTAGVSGAIPSGPLSLAARVSDYTPAILEHALVEDRSVVRVPAMRGAVYLLPVRQAGQGLALAKPGQFRSTLVRAGMKEEAYDALAESVETLVADKQLTGTEIRRAIGGERVARDLPKGTFVFFLRGLSHAGRILRVGVRGGPRSQTFEYRRTEEWLGGPLRVPDETEALTELLPGYLKAHGPASLRDIAWWAGVRQKVAHDALRGCTHREARLEGRDDVLYASEFLLKEPAMFPSKTGLNLLPHWDPYLAAHVDRSRYLPHRWHDHVIDRGGNSTNVILREGMVVGVWDDRDNVLAHAGFESPLDSSSLHAASRRLVAVLGNLDPVKRARPPSLHEGGQNAFRSPLRGVPAAVLRD